MMHILTRHLKSSQTSGCRGGRYLEICSTRLLPVFQTVAIIMVSIFFFHNLDGLRSSANLSDANIRFPAYLDQSEENFTRQLRQRMSDGPGNDLINASGRTLNHNISEQNWPLFGSVFYL